MATAIHSGRPGARSCFTESYGLRHCEGYRVVGPRGPVGYVEEIHVDELGEARAIVVRGARRLLVPAKEIQSMDVEAELVRLIHVPR